MVPRIRLVYAVKARHVPDIWDFEMKVGHAVRPTNAPALQGRYHFVDVILLVVPSKDLIMIVHALSTCSSRVEI